MGLTLAVYQYSFWYKAGKYLCNADAQPTPMTNYCYSECDPPADLEFVIHYLSPTSITATNIKDWAARDPILSQVKRFTEVAW